MRKQGKKINKGMPSGFVLSLAIHATAILLAGLLVVFTVTQKEEKKFVPPKPVDRPKMKLRKPKVKVKKSAKPKATTRIVTKVKRASMPDIQLPEMSGMSDGLVGGVGGFDIMPDISEVTLFGSGQTIGNDFVGTFYDFKRDRRGRPNLMSADQFVDEVAKFVRDGWKVSDFSRFYRSPKKLYATTFMVPTILSLIAPAAFGEPDTIGYAWLVHYKGQVVYKDDITFRFWGHGDDILAVRVAGEIVLVACWPGGTWAPDNIGNFWISSGNNNRRFYLGNNTAVVGDWITLKAGEPLDMEVIIGEVPGGGFSSMLVVEVQGEKYERNKQGGPILPIFKTTEPSLDLQDAIYRDLIEGEASVTNGPIFRDYGREGVIALQQNTNETPAAVSSRKQGEQLRPWTRTNGKTLEAAFVSVIGDQVVVKSARGKQLKISLEQLSPDDRIYVGLANPPEFNIDFTRKSSQRMIDEGPYLTGRVMRINDYNFGVKLKQKSARLYNHELQVEFFAIGKEIDGSRYVLLDRQEQSFTPTKENKRSFSFKGDSVEMMDYELHGTRRGMKSVGYLITITDERGEIIQHNESNPWLYENIENLKNLPVGRYMDKTCTRVFPTSPPAYFY